MHTFWIVLGILCIASGLVLIFSDRLHAGRKTAASDNFPAQQSARKPISAPVEQEKEVATLGKK